jgi:hypothetical protein
VGFIAEDRHPKFWRMFQDLFQARNPGHAVSDYD